VSVKVDLKSKEVRQGFSFDFGWIFVVLAVVLGFVVFYVIGLNMDSMRVAKEKQLQDLQQKIAGFQGIQGQLSNIQGDINAIIQQINKLRELRYDPLRYSVLLTRLSQLVPSNVWLSNLDIDPTKNQISLSATAEGEPGHPPLASIADFIMNLQDDKDNYFSNVVLQSTTSQSGGSSGQISNLWNFSLQANYNIPLITSGNGHGSITPPASVPEATPSPANTPSPNSGFSPAKEQKGASAKPSSVAPTAGQSPKQNVSMPSQPSQSPKVSPQGEGKNPQKTPETNSNVKGGKE
jgi:Tfp pilus assembly protein PilN